ncbi:hypothetical protein EV127DRAFT_435722 [Xylaria flabelliformis]|nr:hypothetical protein EV127DRAFT_435722 [Xylaria flabelliformis]
MANGGGKTRDTQPVVNCNVMDVVDNKGTEQAPLSNQCYPSNTSEILFEPEQKAPYRCRWIHLTYRYAKFDEFLIIVEQTLRTWDNEERRRIMTALRTLKHRHELRGMNGPNFRPGLFPLFGDELHENLLHCLEQTEVDSNQPLLVVIPTLHARAPGFRPHQKSKNEDWTGIHISKSLLEYHYRLNGDLADASNAEVTTTPTPACVQELWCVVVDKKNIITASNFAAKVILPNAKDLSLATTTPPVSFTNAFWENPPLSAEELSSRYRLQQHPHRTLITVIGVVGFFISHLIPVGGRLAYKLTDLITEKLSGLKFSKVARFISLSITLEIMKYDPNLKRIKSGEKNLLSVTAAGSKTKANDLKLCSLRESLREWAKAESDMRLRMHEEGPPEEIFTSLKRLWTNALVFSTNFFLDSKGHIRALEPRKTHLGSWFSWRNKRTKTKQQGEAKDSDVLDAPITYQPRKLGETLRDLEEDLSKTLANLKWQTQSGIDESNSKNNIDRENRRFLEDIEKSGSNAALFCLLRVCILTTPSRFPSFNTLVVDFYARKISRIEWLIRDQVTQSLVYQLSKLAEELRIMRDIVISQREVVAKIAERFSAALSVKRDLANNDMAPKNTVGSTGKKEWCDQAQNSSRIANTLHAKARIKHENLLVDLEKLEDTTERLKRQAALLLDIKTEGQNTAIFIFTVVTVIFLPLSFVTSYLGMNTSDIRDLEQGQWIFWAIGITLTIAILIIVWLISVKGGGWRTSRQANRFYGFEE